MVFQENLVQIIINAKDNFSRAFNKAQKAAQNLQKTMIGFAAIGAVAAVGIAKATKKAIDFEEVVSKFEVVFKGVNKASEEAAKNLQKNFGVSLLAAKTLLSGTGDLLTGFGFTSAAALDLSEQVATLGADIASFTNLQGGAERATRIITKSLTGEREGLKELGVVVSEAAVAAKLLTKGQKDLTGQLLLEAKAIATVDIILEQSNNALGDFERTSGSAANQLKITKAAFEDLQVSIGEGFLPVLQFLLPIIQKVIDIFMGLPDPVKQFIVVMGIAAVALGVLAVVVLAFTAVSTPWLIITFKIIAAITLIILVIKNWKLVLIGIAKATLAVSGLLIRAWARFRDFWIVLWNRISNVFKSIWNGIVDFLQSAVQKAIDILNFLIRAINKIPGISIPVIPDIDFSGLKAELTDIGKLQEDLAKKREELAESLKRAEDDIIEKLKQKIGFEEKVTEELEKQEEVMKELTKAERISQGGFQFIKQTGDVFNPKVFSRSEFQTRDAFEQAKRGAGITINIDNVVGLDPQEISQALSDEFNNKVSL